ncbi:TonB-dependent receptor [Geobacter luticola]|uniref:TonB-dependent receptor n=2 Tax=Geomobilimonas luticola TaxID=1114878 RepID=A0ABS5S9R2_9BACT|nr:TonB-dependent receptor [Geomobilimonas luticola]
MTGVPAFGADNSNNLMLDEIVVRGEKESPREESLTIREVRESPARDIGEALKAVEGVSIVHKGAIANDVVIRGFQKDNINVFLDGERIHGACPSRMDPPSFHYDFAEVEQIKVIKGPYDLANPGGLGGVVEARSKKPKKGFDADISATGGSYDSVNASAVGSYGGEKFDGLLGYAYKFSRVPTSGDGKLITDIYPATSKNRYRDTDMDSAAYSINSAWTRLGFNPNENSRMEVGYSLQEALHVLYPYLLMDGTADTTNRVNWSYTAARISPLLKEIRLQGYWNHITHLMSDKYRVSSLGLPQDYSMQTNADTMVYGAKINGTLAVGPGDLRTGIDYYNRNWNATNVRKMYMNYLPVRMIPDVSIDNLGLFGEYTVPLGERVKLTAGVRGDLAWAEADASNVYVTPQNDSTDFRTVNANVQLTYTPLKGVETYVGFGRGSRTPDPQELYIDLPAIVMPGVLNPGQRGNADLKVTVNHQVDLGLKYHTETFFITGSFFYSDLSDYVNYYQASPTLKSYRNVDATMWGYEVGSQVVLPRDFFLKGSLSYTWGDNDDTHAPLSEIPPLRGTIGVRYDNNAFFAEVAENLSSRQERVDLNLKEQPTAGYATTDLKGGFRFKALSVFAGVNNLLDKQYYNYLSYQRDPFASGAKVPENGRNYYITAQYTF